MILYHPDKPFYTSEHPLNILCYICSKQMQELYHENEEFIVIELANNGSLLNHVSEKNILSSISLCRECFEKNIISLPEFKDLTESEPATILCNECKKQCKYYKYYYDIYLNLEFNLTYCIPCYENIVGEEFMFDINEWDNGQKKPSP